MREETRRLWDNFNAAAKKYYRAEPNSRAEAIAEREMHKTKREFEEHLNRIDDAPRHDPADWDTPHWAGPSD